MATVSQAVLNVDQGLPPNKRFIFLTEADFAGGTGEGNFISAGTPDTIDVRAALGRSATYVEVTVEETSGGSGDSYTIEILLNNTFRVFPQSDTGMNNMYGNQISDWANPVTVTNTSNPIGVVAPAGSVVSYSQVADFDTLSVNGAAGGAGALGKFTLLIR